MQIVLSLQNFDSVCTNSIKFAKFRFYFVQTMLSLQSLGLHAMLSSQSFHSVLSWQSLDSVCAKSVKFANFRICLCKQCSVGKV